MHTTLENELVVAVAAPPASAIQPHLGHWQSIINTAYSAPNQWFKVKRSYANRNSTTNLARSAIRELLGEAAVDAFEFAYQPTMLNGAERHEIYLRYVPPPTLAEAPASDIMEFFNHASPEEQAAYLSRATAEAE